MSIQWTLVAGVMYVELFVTVIMLLPFLSPQRWNSFFKSSFLRSIGNMAHIYFKIFLGVLTLCFVDAIREMRKYGQELDDHQSTDHGIHLDADMQAHMRLFRAQRNFYISGFSLFLWVVLQRLATLLSRLAVTMAEREAALKQAASASATASQLMAKDKKEKEKEDEDEDDQEANITNTIKELREENRILEAEYKAALRQAKSVTEEYDRLLEEHSKLQEEQKKSSPEQSKKDE